LFHAEDFYCKSGSFFKKHKNGGDNRLWAIIIGMSKLTSTNPGDNYAVIGDIEVTTPEEVTEKIAAANKAKTAWKELGVAGRIKLLRPIQAEFSQRKEEIAQLLTKEIGKPISQTRGEAEGYTEEFTWFMDHAEEALKDEVTYEDDKSHHRIVYEPFGTAAVITPWNFPYGMAIWGIVPNLLAGNTVVFKISEECPLIGKFMAEVFAGHDLPEGVFSEVYGLGEVGEALSKGDINLIWFTGSTKTGKSLYKTAAKKFIKAVLEMGGSNPGIVFEDVDITKAVELIYDGRFYNCGQVCDAIKRLIVHESIKDDFIAELTKVLWSKKIGHPTSEDTDIGSLVAKRQVDLLEEQVQDALDKGAQVVVRLDVLEGLKGAYYPPTILDNITKDMRVWKEEVFGPVLPVVAFKDEAQAIRMANDTPYGLGSRVVSADKKRAERVASQIQAGTVEVNEGDRWLTCNPFGGYKNSGMGREHGTLGLRELSQVKVISSSK
jgi:succinate-semialdehyde dehydrogenase/glutarate-semialdehyde dehydrogenase